jgi:hypothetical protein
MNNVIELRRPVKVGDEVILRRINVVPMTSGTTYTVSRIEDRRLFGFQRDDTHPGTERWITKDYKTPLSKTFEDGETVVLGVTYPDGTRLL